MDQVVYRLREGRSVNGDIQAIGERIEEIRGRFQDGSVPTEVVVDEARDPQSPLHGDFTWDDTEAARLQRLSEARRLMQSYEVHYIGTDRGVTQIHCPANVSVRYGKDRGYIRVSDAMTQIEIKQQLFAECLAQIAGVQNRLDHLKALTPRIQATIENLKTEVEKQAKKAGGPKRRRRTA